ncbi:MAG: dihydrodipicolinate synthase family protein [Thermomicrobiales bacterium]
MTQFPTLRPDGRTLLHQGTVIPAHPLALNSNRELDPVRQAALTKYYLAAGSGGVAVGVHTTQFAIREVGLYESVLRIGAETTDKVAATTGRTLIKVAGVIGPTAQAVAEARVAADLGYDLALVGLGGTTGWSDDELVDHVRQVAKVIPAFGFYLQPSVGGRPLPYSFWRKLAEVEGVQAIKIAPFNRYQTLDVVRAVAESSRSDEIALYTGNDDNIVADLLAAYRFEIDGVMVEKRIVGGLLGHWAAWNKTAVELHAACQAAITDPSGSKVLDLLTNGNAVTDSNDAFFDSRNSFIGSIAGIHEVLRRQGLLEGRWCIDPNEDLSPGQLQEIDRVYAAYPELNDDAFVAAHLDEWLTT